MNTTIERPTQQPRKYQSHRRTGENSPRVTVVLPAADKREIKERAAALGCSESAVIAAMVAGALRPPAILPADEEGEEQAAA